MNEITITHLARNLADIVNRVLYRGERFRVMRGGRPAVELSPPARARRLGDLPDILARLPRLGPEEAEEFARDLERARTEIGPPPDDPWES